AENVQDAALARIRLRSWRGVPSGCPILKKSAPLPHSREFLPILVQPLRTERKKVQTRANETLFWLLHHSVTFPSRRIAPSLPQFGVVPTRKPSRAPIVA